MKRTLLGMLALFAAANVYAQPNSGGATDDDLQLNTITTALPFMAITPDSRAGGMGDAGTALSGSSTSIYWNTSMLIFAEDESEISISYTPWLRQLTNDIHLSYLSGYVKLGERHAVGGAMRYFSLGEITFTDQSGEYIRNDKPSEFEFTGSYAFRLGQRTSIGLNGKFAYSNLTGGLPVEGVDTKAAMAGAADLSFTYFNDEAKLGDMKADYTFATTINNLGNKVSYSSLQNRDFIPMNIKIANALKLKFDKYNDLTFALEFQKLLVPTPALYDVVDSQRVMIAGRSSDVGVISGLVQSFYDAPGKPVTDENGDYVQNADGSYQIKKGSRFKEELSEINIAFGMEYWYNDLFAVRGGYFFEAKNKGSRQYFNFGAGLKYNRFGIDLSYLAAVGGRQSPLANTLRFTLRFTLGDKATNSTDSSPQ